MEVVEQECPDCNGYGTDYDGYWGCETCKGEGYVLVEVAEDTPILWEGIDTD